jgi:hypothetical protein
VSLAEAAQKGCYADGAVAVVLPSASWTTLSLSRPAKQVGFVVFDLLGGDPLVNAVLQISPHCCDASPLGLSHPLWWPSEPGCVLDPCCVVMCVRLAKVLIVSRFGECLFCHDLGTEWLGAHPGIMQVVALLQEFPHIVSVKGE